MTQTGQHFRRWRGALGLGAVGWLLCAVALRAQPEGSISALVDLRLSEASSENGWLASGLDKLRFAGDDGLRLGAGLIEARGRFTPTLSGKVTLAAYDGLGAAIHATEAYLQLSPVPRSALRFQARLGAFYPPISLENSGVAWTSPYTLSFSAIDSWLGEELRTIGFELQASEMGAFRGSPDDFSVTGAVFRFNDPAGALLSWRGWALHDRQTGLFEQLPFAPLPNFLPGGAYFPVQESHDDPFVELDGRNGWYGGAEWKRLDRSRLRLLHYDNRGDPTVVSGGQWAWRTRFDHIGWQFRAGPRTEFLVQGLRGDTRMDGYEGPLVENRYWSFYGLVSQVYGPQRLSLRFDRFGVIDDDQTSDDPNAEQGSAWTAAYFFTPARALLAWPSAGSLRFGAELLVVTARRPARELLGKSAYRRETSLQLSAQWRH